MRARRSPGALLVRGLLVALAAGVLPLAAGPSARAGELCPLDDLDSGVWLYLSRHVTGGNLANLFFDAPEPTTSLFFDDRDDAVDRDGNPAEGPDILCAMPFVVTAGGESVYETLRLDGLADEENVVVVAPVTPSESLLNATALLFEPVATNTLPDPLGMQLGNAFAGGSNPNYANPSFIELDGAHTWPGAYFANDRWNLDLTEYRDGGFTQGESSDLIVVIGPDWWMKIKVPPAPDFADTWGIYVVAGGGIDLMDLGNWQPQALPQVSVTEAEPTPTPTPAVAAPADTPTPSPSPSPSPTGGTPPASTTDGGPPLLWLIAGALLTAGVVGGLLVARSRQSNAGSATSVSQVAADMIAADVANTPLVGRAWKETAQETSGSRTALMAGGALLALLVVGGATAVATGVIGGPAPAADPSQSQVAGASEPAAPPSESSAAEPSRSQPVAGPPFPELAARGLAPPDPIADALEPVGLHSLEGVDGEYFPDSANAVEYAAWVTNLDQATVDTLFNATTFDCTNLVDGVRTACASNNPIDPGPMFVAAARFAEPIPQESSDGLMVYSLVLDADGDPANNYVAEPPFTNDFFQGTDRWYELTYTPQAGWVLSVDRDTASSDARVAIMGDLIVFFVPMAELPTDEPGYRLTSFVSSDASFEPATSGGDLVPGPPDAGFELADPAVGGGAATGFLVRLGEALAEGDTRFLLDRLHSAVIDRYGASACLIYVDAVVDPSNAIDPVRAGALEQWDYETDGLSTSIAEAYPVSASATMNGQAVEDAEFHVAIENGTFRWFTDCGVPEG